MKGNMEERARNLAEYIIEHDATVRRTAEAIGIVSGRAEKTFDPYSSITRQEVAVILTAMSRVTGDSTGNPPVANVVDRSSIASWALSSVDYVVSNQIMVGTGTSFQPETYATRGSISESLANMSMEDIPYTTTSTFTDVKGSGFESVVAWCASNGLMSGLSTTNFGVSDNVTREQFALILKQFATYQGQDTSVTLQQVNSLNAFSDSSSISTWAKEGVAWAVANGLMAGSDGLLSPSGNITRAQVATMLYTYGITFG